MQYRRLGRSSLNVSIVGFGTAQLRLIPERQAIETIKTALQAGVNLFHTAPDYEGTDDLIITALNECDPPHPVHICNVAWGDIAFFEGIFEQTCRKLDTDVLDIFGIADIYSQEKRQQNVWGKGGMVEFLLKKKEEGRLKAIFCSTHGPVRHTSELLKRNIFDVIMLAYNRLGFHLVSYNPENFIDIAGLRNQVEGKWEFEYIPRVEEEIFPLIDRFDVGLLVMKPFAGGLLTDSKAFPPKIKLSDSSTADLSDLILKDILRQRAVSCVVPGTATIKEAKQNARVGAEGPGLLPEEEKMLQDHILERQAKLCDRCGRCDVLCSRNLKISWIFRAAHLELFPSATYEHLDGSQYFTLHPRKKSMCADCTDITCRCPRGINIRQQLMDIHERMLSAAKHQLIPGLPKKTRYRLLQQDFFKRDKEHAFEVLKREIPQVVRRGEQIIIRLCLRNTGNRVWFVHKCKGRSLVRLAVYLNKQLLGVIKPRANVPPGEKIHFVYKITAPPAKGHILVKMDLFEHEVKFFSDAGYGPVKAKITVI